MTVAFDPVHPGEVLAEQLDALKMSAAAAARALGIPQSRLSQILNGRRSITADTALRLSRWLGTDDENRMTSLAGRELWPDPLGQVANIRNLAGHPYEFYQKVGFTIVGVLPDANGPGKPDIFMAKSIKQK